MVRPSPLHVSSPVGAAAFFRSAEFPPTPPVAVATDIASAAAAAAAEAFGDFGEALEDIGELLQAAPPLHHHPRRGTSVGWWEATTNETLSEPDTFTEHTLDSADTSVSSTRASTSAATGGTGSQSRVGRGSRRGFSVMVRGGRSPNAHGYRGRSVTRREGRGGPGAALRHRHPTHTPSRGPTARGGLGGLETALGATGLVVPAQLGIRGALALGPLSLAGGHAAGRGSAAALLLSSVGRDQETSRIGPHRHPFQISRVREEPAESGWPEGLGDR